MRSALRYAEAATSASWLTSRLCLTDIVDPYEGIDHRDSYLTTEEKAANTQLTICCSRPVGPLIDLDLS